MPYRDLLDPLLLSTAPHFLAILPIMSCSNPEGYPGLYTGYAAVIGTSTLLSFLWHGQHEDQGLLFWLDYGFAFLWTAYDVTIGVIVAPAPSLIAVILLNALCMATNQMTDWVSKRGYISYQKAHSMWHLLNVSKSVTVSWLLCGQ